MERMTPGAKKMEVKFFDNPKLQSLTRFIEIAITNNPVTPRFIKDSDELKVFPVNIERKQIPVHKFQANGKTSYIAINDDVFNEWYNNQRKSWDKLQNENRKIKEKFVESELIREHFEEKVFTLMAEMEKPLSFWEWIKSRLKKRGKS
jgi:hypothetical protein